MNAPIRKPLGFVVRPEDLHLFTAESAKDIFEHEQMSMTGQVVSSKQAYSLEGVRKLIADKEYFDALVEYIKDPKKAKINIATIRDLSLAINKNAFVKLVRVLMEEHKLDDIPDIKSKLALLEDTLSIENVTSGSESYTTTIQGETITIPTRTLVDYISHDGRYIDYDTISSLYGYEPKHFVYAARKFADEKKLHSNCVMDPHTFTFVSSLKQDQILDTMSLDEITGEVITDEILENIFDNFCIGK